MYYVLVTAPMDVCFVGPFASRIAAEDWKQKNNKPELDLYVMTADEMKTNIADHGVCGIMTPEEYEPANLIASTRALEQ